MTYTLAQFEQIDGLLNAVLRRPALESIEHRDAREVYFRPEWKLHDALVDALGLDHVDRFASAEECAVEFVTRCLMSSTLVEA